jgi:hypothetical protein
VSNEPDEIVRGSGNVFRDFGYPDADVRKAKAALGTQIMKILDEDGGVSPNRRKCRRAGFRPAERSRERELSVFRWMAGCNPMTWNRPECPLRRSNFPYLTCCRKSSRPPEHRRNFLGFGLTSPDGSVRLRIAPDPAPFVRGHARTNRLESYVGRFPLWHQTCKFPCLNILGGLGGEAPPRQ